MAKISDIVKSVIDKETISKNKWLIMLIIASLGGGTGTVLQTFNVEAKEAEKIKAIREVAEGFQAAIAKPPSKSINKTEKYIDCTNCIKIMKEYIDKQTKLHKKREH